MDEVQRPGSLQRISQELGTNVGVKRDFDHILFKCGLDCMGVHMEDPHETGHMRYNVLIAVRTTAPRVVLPDMSPFQHITVVYHAHECGLAIATQDVVKTTITTCD